MNKKFLLALLIVVAVILFYNSSTKIEGFSNYSLGAASGIYPSAQTEVLLQDSFPITGKNGVSKNGSNQIWYHYPIFEVGSYDQITNNLKYPNNPDTGRCMAAEFCGTLYKEKQMRSNYIKQLPPVNPDCGTRVGYFATYINMLPFRNDMANILY
jgi:hypothetical protein